jgi:peptide/nickel transport system permease protein
MTDAIELLPAVPVPGRRRRAFPIRGFFAMGFIALIVTLPFLTPEAEQTADLLMPPSADHLLGTDRFGQDVFLRLLHGGSRSRSWRSQPARSPS